MLEELAFRSEDASRRTSSIGHTAGSRNLDRPPHRPEPARTKREAASFHDDGISLSAVRKRGDRDDILRSVAGKVPPKTMWRSLNSHSRLYVRQAQLIDLEESEVLAAVNDFLMASETIGPHGQEHGHISRAGVEAFSGELSKKEKVARAYSEKSESDRGQLLYYDCMDHTAKLEGLETPAHFTRGSFHALAEDRLVGWHPNYAVELSARNDGCTDE